MQKSLKRSAIPTKIIFCKLETIALTVFLYSSGS